MISPYRVYSDLPIFNESRAWIEINTAAIRRNYRALCDFAKKNGTNAAVSGVIKAEGYGHGAKALTEVLLAEGCRFFCCASAEEAVTIRKVCDQSAVDAEILVLGYTPAANAAQLLKYRIIQNVFSLDYAKALSDKAQELGGAVAVHVKINTGMNRLGFAANDDDEMDAAVRDIVEMSSLSGICIKGAFTQDGNGNVTLNRAGSVVVGEETGTGVRRFLCHRTDYSSKFSFSITAVFVHKVFASATISPYRGRF